MSLQPRAMRIIAGLALCAFGGGVCAWIGTPIPWMLGSMLSIAVAQMAGADLETLPGGRPAGMIIVGVALGLYFTAPVLQEVATSWPWFLALGIAAHAFGTVSALVLERLSGVDRATAYFGSMPGGASEMSQMAETHGAQPDKVAIAHSLRMLLVVTLFPAGITLAGFHASEAYQAVRIPYEWQGLVMLLALGASAGLVARFMR